MDAVNATYSDVYSTYQQTKEQLSQLEEMMGELDLASFRLLEGEGLIHMVPGKWWRDGKDQGPEGLLYLTDQRLVFEQKEEVATRKVLFITTEKELVRGTLFEVPIGLVESVKATSQGLFGNEDHLEMSFGTGADYASAHFHLKGQDSEEWARLVNRTVNGQIQSERYYAPGETPAAVSAALEDSLKAAPQQCTSCGAPFSAPIAAGQRQAQCEYCGTTMRW